jgi:hypothetical protein
VAAIVVGQGAIRLPQWGEMLIGIPAMLGVYGWIIWTKGFGDADRALFRKGNGGTQ